MKAIAVFLLFVGMFLVIQGYYSQSVTQQCPAPQVQVKYIPRSEYDEMMSPDGNQIAKQFKGMFEDIDPIMGRKQ